MLCWQVKNNTSFAHQHTHAFDGVSDLWGKVSLKNIPEVARTSYLMRSFYHKCNKAFSRKQQRSLLDHIGVPSGESKCSGQCLFGIIFLQYFIDSFFEVRKNFLTYLIESQRNISCICLHDALYLRHSYLLYFYLCNSFNFLQILLLISCYKGYASSTFSCSSRSSTSMYVRVNIWRRLQLYNQIYITYVQSSGCYIGCY